MEEETKQQSVHLTSAGQSEGLTRVAHTLGPWHFSGLHIRAADGSYIADIKLDDEDPEVLANRALIVAAPEMLSALQYIEDTLFEGEEWDCDIEETEGFCSGQCHANGCMKMKARAVRSAIAKAVGQDPNTPLAGEEGSGEKTSDVGSSS